MSRIQGNIAEIEEDLKTESYEDVLTSIRYAAKKVEKEIEQLAISNEISYKTKLDKIDIVHGELIGLGLANELKRSNINLTEEQIKKTVQDVKQGWKALDIQQQNALVNLTNSKTAQYNARTNFREFLEKARNNEFGNEIQREALQLQKFLKTYQKAQD